MTTRECHSRILPIFNLFMHVMHIMQNFNLSPTPHKSCVGSMWMTRTRSDALVTGLTPSSSRRRRPACCACACARGVRLARCCGIPCRGCRHNGRSASKGGPAMQWLCLAVDSCTATQQRPRRLRPRRRSTAAAASTIFELKLATTAPTIDRSRSRAAAPRTAATSANTEPTAATCPRRQLKCRQEDQGGRGHLNRIRALQMTR